MPVEVDNGKKTVYISYIKVNTFRDIPYRMVIMHETTETEIESNNNDVKDKISIYYKNGSYDIFDIANHYYLDMSLEEKIQLSKLRIIEFSEVKSFVKAQKNVKSYALS